MEMLKEWLIGVCSFTITSTVLYLLLPQDRITDTVKTVLRFLLLVIIFLPLCYSDFSWNNAMNIIFNSEDHMMSITETDETKLIQIETESVISSQVDSILSESYNGTYELDIDMDISSDRCIHIKRIRIILLSETQAMSEIKKMMESFFPTCEIIIEGKVKKGDA